MHYLMFYEYTDDYLERRGQFRGAHLNMRGERRSAANWSSAAHTPIPPTARRCCSNAIRPRFPSASRPLIRT